MWKVGGAEMWFGGETDQGCCEMERALIMEREKQREAPRGLHKENSSLKYGKTRGADFYKFLQPLGSKTEVS